MARRNSDYSRIINKYGEVFDHLDLRDFLVSQGYKPSAAYGVAERAIESLLDCISPSTLVSVCTKCNKRRGRCRCAMHGFSDVHNEKIWHYYDRPGMWVISVHSFLQLRNNELSKLSAAPCERIIAFYDYLAAIAEQTK